MTERSLGCARCGSCCESIPMPALWQLKKSRLAGRYDDNPRMAEDVDFMSKHWHLLTEQPGHYSCDQFDPDARLCLAQDAKPPVCRNYPWYEGTGYPDHAKGLPPQCSYLLDVRPDQRPQDARPLIPIEVVHG